MGSVFSRPKMPKAPSLPSITDTPNPTPGGGNNGDPPAGSGGGDTDKTPELTPDEQRVQNILTRRRGRLGTINTSFGGILSDTTAPARKTLLGE